MNKKVIKSGILDRLLDRAIYKEAEEDNIEFGRALKEISEKDLKNILGIGEKQRALRRILWERIAWCTSVAALLAVAITVPIGIENESRNRICNIVYSYNVGNLSEMIELSARSANDSIPDITSMSDEQLKERLGALKSDFEKSDNPQEISIYGKILAFSYIRLHKSKEARKVLEKMIAALSSDDDYQEAVSECESLLDQIR